MTSTITSKRYTWKRLPRNDGIPSEENMSHLGGYVADGGGNKAYCEDCYLPMPCPCWYSNMRKRSREEDVFPAQEDDNQQGGHGHHCDQQDGPANRKRRRRDDAVVTFDAPHPCGFGASRCRFRLSCSYHHGDPTPCDCDAEYCERGHAHRRPPRPCDHGMRCRWNTLLECSFHHGDPQPCDCNSIDCPKAHLRRTKRQKEFRVTLKEASKIRKEKQQAAAKDSASKEKQQQTIVALPKKTKKTRKKSKGKMHYSKWRGSQKTGETNAQKRARYLETYNTDGTCKHAFVDPA
mmetsp:Transcript_3370/g.5530  ORF Transcript_3370/g.5530 Transcript_3370/m.5530 type:complete len:292 (+) Transcript_3370:192-1067(+)